MPSTAATSNPIKFPEPDYKTLGNFKRGVITLIDQSRTPENALIQFDNGWLVEDGQPSIRPGTNWYGIASPNGLPIDGFDTFDFNGTIHLVMVAGGVVYRSITDGSTWDQCTGGTTTPGVPVNFNQNNMYLTLTTGVDNIIRYVGTTSLVLYTLLTTPAAPTVAQTGTTGTGFTSYIKIAAVNAVGFSAASSSLTVTANIDRSSYDATHYNTYTLPAYQTGQTRYDIYYSTDNINFNYLDSVTSPNTTYRDDGTAIVSPSIQAPTDNTTLGPLYAELTNVGSRQYGVRDPGHRYRIGFTGTGNFSGAFSSAYDGGYLDWQPGGKYYPVKVADYRDGKGTPLATVFCDSADGEGCIIQMSLDTLTIQDISITVPSAYKLPGSRGTPAPGSVINVLNDYYFYNSQAFYGLGNNQGLQQIINTSEMSSNIRPTIKKITTAGEKNIASAYVDGKVYWSVCYGTTSNNATIVFDTELKAWLPTAFNGLGFNKFVKYTDANKVHHLLAYKPGDNRLTEISTSIQGDYGQPFKVDMYTGLYSISKDRFQFQFTEEMEYEFSNPQGNIGVELKGIDRVKDYSSIVSKVLSITGTVVNSGNSTVSGNWDTFGWDMRAWDSAPTAPTTISPSSVQKYSTVQRELRAVQWHISSYSLDARWVLRTLQTWGTLTQAGHPPNSRI